MQRPAAVRYVPVIAGALAALLIAGAPSDASPAKADSARTALEPPHGAARQQAAGGITARVGGRDAGREILVIGVRGLAPRTEYDVCCDDPSTADTTPQKFATVRTGRSRRASLRYDTGRGDRLPFGATIDQLSAAAFQVRSPAGYVVLSGGMPDPRGVKQAPAPGEPVANAGPDRTIEIAGLTTAVTLDGSASADPEGAALTYAWSGDFTEATATGAMPTIHFAGAGSHTVTLVVNDGSVDSAPDQAVVDIVDTTPPVLTVTGLPTSFWPPNHALVRVQPTVVATDDSGVAPVVTLAITSNEPDDGTGDGNTTGDIVIRSPSDFDLRAERSGPGSGRTYRMVWTATDGSGNRTRFSADVNVPHDRGRGRGRGK